MSGVIPLSGCRYWRFLLCILMIALLSARKTHLLILLSVAFLFYHMDNCSLLMRLRLYPGYKLWYELSILALFAAPYLVYMFLYHFVESRDKYMKRYGCWLRR
ncbi:MAG: hypothetical protein ACLUOI_23075 [Eisenbergiella sp.]